MAAKRRDELIRIYRETRTIAVVGASENPSKPAYQIPAYLQGRGYRILPVNPRGGVIYGEPVYRSLDEIAMTIDVVDVFRPPAEAESVARAAIAAGARVLWFQPGTDTDAAVQLAEAAGLVVVGNLCMGATHGRLGLGPGPERSAEPETEARSA